MATLDIKPAATEPQLNLLMPKGSLDQPLWKSLFQNLDDFFFPKKQAPLVLTSKPVPVRDIWGFYDYKKNGALGSTLVHVVLIGAVIGLTILGRRVVTEVTKPHETVTLISPDDVAVLQPAKTQAGGGGGGGDRDKFQAPKGRLPKASMEQITPPAMVVRNDHPKLTAEPTVVLPPQIKMAANNLPNIGDITSHLPSGPPSNGTGSGGGIGAGSGGGVSAPKSLFAPDPEYSEEARKAKYQGTCVLYLIVGPDGKPRDIRVARSLGLGLDEKAIEAVRQWKFEPAMKDGKPVAVAINVEVDFRLY